MKKLKRLTDVPTGGIKRLSDVRVGESAVVCAVQTEGNMRRRFLDMGMTVGSEILCIGRSPLGDPRAYLVRGKVIAIRNKDAYSVVLKRQ